MTAYHSIAITITLAAAQLQRLQRHNCDNLFHLAITTFLFSHKNVFTRVDRNLFNATVSTETIVNIARLTLFKSWKSASTNGCLFINRVTRKPFTYRGTNAGCPSYIHQPTMWVFWQTPDRASTTVYPLTPYIWLRKWTTRCQSQTRFADIFNYRAFHNFCSTYTCSCLQHELDR